MSVYHVWPPNPFGQGALGYPEQALSVILEDN